VQSFAQPPVARQFLIFDPEDGGDTLLRNMGSNTDYTALYPRRWHTFITRTVRTSNASKGVAFVKKIMIGKC
jgi:hypothetical protein